MEKEKLLLLKKKLKNFGRYRRLGMGGESTGQKLKKYGVFDLPGCTLGFQEVTCHELRPCSTLLTLYAKMGLHRYNLLEGTKFQLNGVKKYIRPVCCPACPYYITLDAVDTTGGSSLLQTFQTKVSEEIYRKFILTCDITRIRGDRRDDDPASMRANIRIRNNDPAMITNFPMPEWPPENPFDIYYRVKKSELQDNDWIRLYLELAVASAGASDDALSNLEIVTVAIGDEGGLNANNATLYIRYNDLSLGKVSDRVALVRRSFDEATGCFLLVGLTRESSLVIPNKRTVASDEDTGPEFCGEPLADNKRTKLHLTGLANQISEDPNQLPLNYDADAMVE
ncbi:unnamed protein product [Thlaspi arvense]|uniref:Uncharacterized protein n=1 Tax=Thlaspi arvense TaxID=13288 RepID=A0AAU9RTF6_THLAR|nr:unnamed protein product [Thlaspi arvense]